MAPRTPPDDWRRGLVLPGRTVVRGRGVQYAVPGAVNRTRERYHHRAVETPWQRRWVRRFPALLERLDGRSAALSR